MYWHLKAKLDCFSRASSRQLNESTWRLINKCPITSDVNNFWNCIFRLNSFNKNSKLKNPLKRDILNGVRYSYYNEANFRARVISSWLKKMSTII